MNVRGLPVAVVEDKAPGEDLANALRECQLYAHELNKQFATGINPCRWCLVTDGIRLIVCQWDGGKPELDCEVKDLVVGATVLQRLHELIV